jgi:cobalt/nickel transport system permease protein
VHISDGILPLYWCAVWYLLCIPFWIAGVKEINRRKLKNPKYLPTLAMAGAAVFVISVWHIPVPVTGSCSHPVGTPMAAILIGPFATVVISSIALFFQAFLGHGGITTLGANTFSMGIVGTFTGYYTYILLKDRTPLWFSAGMAGFIGDMMTYVTSALELALGLNPHSVLQHWLLYFMGYGPTQIPIAIGEFLFTAGVISYIAENRPDILGVPSYG